MTDEWLYFFGEWCLSWSSNTQNTESILSPLAHKRSKSTHEQRQPGATTFRATTEHDDEMDQSDDEMEILTLKFGFIVSDSLLALEMSGSKRNRCDLATWSLVFVAGNAARYWYEVKILDDAVEHVKQRIWMRPTRDSKASYQISSFFVRCLMVRYCRRHLQKATPVLLI
jgi:hypothetical protein